MSKALSRKLAATKINDDDVDVSRVHGVVGFGVSKAAFYSAYAAREGDEGGLLAL